MSVHIYMCVRLCACVSVCEYMRICVCACVGVRMCAYVRVVLINNTLSHLISRHLKYVLLLFYINNTQ